LFTGHNRVKKGYLYITPSCLGIYLISCFHKSHLYLQAISIAIHNIPEGLIVAAPIYAATGSKLKSLGMAAASGLSEPLGALLGVTLARPFLVESMLDNVLAVVGGVMLSVCVFELWPEGRNCRRDDRLALGSVLGALVIGATLIAGA
jgi:zinc transporter, ZIP family